MRRLFDEQLKQLNNTLIEMVELVEHAIKDANTALIDQNVTLAQKIIDRVNVVYINQCRGFRVYLTRE